jgi:hypothetical protein
LGRDAVVDEDESVGVDLKVEGVAAEEGKPEEADETR